MPEFTTKNIIDKCNNKKPEKYNVFTFFESEEYTLELAKTQHNFFCFNLGKEKSWDTQKYPLTSNIFLLSNPDSFTFIKYDFILSQNRLWQFQTAKNIQEFIKIPIIALEHYFLSNDLSDSNKEHLSNMVADFNVFTSKAIMESWNLNHNNQAIELGAMQDDGRILVSEISQRIFIEKWNILFDKAYEESQK